VLAGQRTTNAVAVGYGPGPLVTPVADILLGQLPAEGINLREFLRAEQGRYWSYLCASPACCPPAVFHSMRPPTPPPWR
jgi:Domain of unknown function (DUF4192)